jgi:hypothetical protein
MEDFFGQFRAFEKFSDTIFGGFSSTTWFRAGSASELVRPRAKSQSPEGCGLSRRVAIRWPWGLEYICSRVSWLPRPTAMDWMDGELGIELGNF